MSRREDVYLYLSMPSHDEDTIAVVGPFEFVQVTYVWLRAGTSAHQDIKLGQYDSDNDVWNVLGTDYSDFTISARPPDAGGVYTILPIPTEETA